MRPCFAVLRPARLVGGLALLGWLLPGLAHAGAPPTPLLNDGTVAVVRIELPRLRPETLDRLSAGLGDRLGGAIPPLAPLARGAARLHEAGIREVYLLYDLTSLGDVPLVAVASPGATEANGALPGPLQPAFDALGTPQAFALIRGWTVAGPADAVARLQNTPPTDRDDLRDALSVPVRRGTITQAAVAPGRIFRRALAEAMPELPVSLGRESTRPLTDGLDWAMIALSDAKDPKLALELQASDEGAAQALVALLARVQATGAATLRAEAQTRQAAPLLEALRFAPNPPPESPRRMTAEADALATLPLVLAPFQRLDAARRRSLAVNQLKNIGVAMHNYHSAHGTFPPAYRADTAGKPLLSWRVLILPWIEEEALYQEFRLNEPWDSPHNLALIPRMPPVYASPLAAPALAREGRTTTLAPRGIATALRNSKGVRMAEIPDGLSHTILALRVPDSAAVVWTRPDDYLAETPPDLGGERSDVLLGDGSVRRLRRDLPPALFRALLTTGGGEVINPDDL